jgi:hypothetical protein
MTEASIATVALDPAALPDFDYVSLGFEAVTASGEYLEFRAVADPVNGWNLLVTCPDDLMKVIEEMMQARARFRQ